MQNNRNFLFLVLCSFLVLLSRVDSVSEIHEANVAAQPTYASIHIGVILDLNSPMGTMADICLSKAHSDFYTEHSDYKTRLFLQTMNAEEEVEVAFAALELLKHKEVHGVLGPELSTEATFVAELGAKAHVPVISFTAKSESFSSKRNPYIIRTTPDDSHQAKALADIFQGFEWHEVVILYEDTEYGNQFLSKLNKALQEGDIRLAYMSAVSTSSKDSDILKELKKLKTFQTRVFLVHMNTSLGCRLFSLARNAEMMNEGFVWLITDSLSNFLYSVDLTCTDSMEGVLGIRPHVPRSNKLDTFKAWWKKKAVGLKPDMAMELNVYCLWAYDTVWSLGLAVEKILPMNSDLSNLSQSENGSNLSNLRVSPFGPKLLSELLDTKFEGLTGEFELVNRQLKPPAFEIFNVIGTGDRAVGYWIPGKGISQKLVATGESAYSTSVKNLKKIMWPGDTVVKPAGWAIPSTGKLKVGVPMKDSFTEFVNLQSDPLTNETKFSGFSIDIFLASLQLLPFKLDFDFIPYTGASGKYNGSYNDMLQKIVDKTYDFVVGDVTILANRSTYVDFTLPYTESGVIMVVRNKKSINMWIFLKPLRWDLWLTIFLACIFFGIVIIVLENQTLNSRTGPLQPHGQELGLFFWFPVAALAFPERNMVASKWSRFLMVVWLFVAYILMQSYTAKLSSIFTVDQLRFAFSKEYYVGYQHGSFVKDFLINDLRFNSSKMRNYSKIEEYHDAMTIGSKNGGIDAIFGEIPYMKLLVNRYGSEYSIVGPVYKTDGFGFAFPLGSPLVSYFSRAILNVTQGTNMTTIEEKNFGPGYPSGLDSINQESPSLTAYNFGGLFIIMGSATVFALFCSETSLGQRFTVTANSFGHWCCTFLYSNGKESRVQSLDHGDISTGDEMNAVELVRTGEVVEPQNGAADLPEEVHESNPPKNANSVTAAAPGELHQPQPRN
ncbi:hypothetical protein M9H77_06381 [Catharanthus roseus]|uniref:Uncharacterized protein n=1 Tax=Catharanthus roseus TaxID=4058 RepID=A0ACC0BS51_CATRO|nr:hypothetical protein M9H77_06381 [Catharanthus roseus]